MWMRFESKSPTKVNTPRLFNSFRIIHLLMSISITDVDYYGWWRSLADISTSFPFPPVPTLHRLVIETKIMRSFHHQDWLENLSSFWLSSCFANGLFTRICPFAHFYAGSFCTRTATNTNTIAHCPWVLYPIIPRSLSLGRAECIRIV